MFHLKCDLENAEVHFDGGTAGTNRFEWETRANTTRPPPEIRRHPFYSLKGKVASFAVFVYPETIVVIFMDVFRVSFVLRPISPILAANVLLLSKRWFQNGLSSLLFHVMTISGLIWVIFSDIFVARIRWELNLKPLMMTKTMTRCLGIFIDR